MVHHAAGPAGQGEAAFGFGFQICDPVIVAERGIIGDTYRFLACNQVFGGRTHLDRVVVDDGQLRTVNYHTDSEGQIISRVQGDGLPGTDNKGQYKVPVAAPAGAFSA